MTHQIVAAVRPIVLFHGRIFTASDRIELAREASLQLVPPLHGNIYGSHSARRSRYDALC